ncbi:MAG: Sapep family Mn(2+)-dependent dipeptidase [Lachnospiraceae bacterium]
MYREKIDAFIDAHRQEMLDDICELCRINSERMPAEEGMPYGPGAAEVLDAAMDMAEGYGFEVTDYDGYVGCADLNDGPRQLDILAHLDVVPAGDGWEITAPFEPIEKDGKLYGRGTADDKGPAVAALYAMRAVKELAIPLTKNVRLILGTDEECGSSDIVHYYAVEEEAPMTFSPDADFPVTNVEKGRLPGHFTAVWEPSDALPKLISIEAGTKLNVVPGKALAMIAGMDAGLVEQTARAVEAETRVQFSISQTDNGMQITAVGAGAHAMMPEEGINAITGLLTLLTRLPFASCGQMAALKEMLVLIPHDDVNGTALGVDMQDELSGRLTLAFSMLKVDDKCLDGQFDSRLPVCATNENVLDVIRENMKHHNLNFLNETMTPPHYVDGNSDFIRTLMKAYEDYTGHKGECQATGGGTYVHNLKNGVAFGASMPGTENRMHGADEFAVIDELMISAKIFAQVIVDLCS